MKYSSLQRQMAPLTQQHCATIYCIYRSLTLLAYQLQTLWQMQQLQWAAF